MNAVFFAEGLDPYATEKTGIEKKIYSQISSIAKFAEVNAVCVRFDRNSIVDKFAFVLPFVISNRERGRDKLLEAVNDKTDFIYIRKPTLTNRFYMMLKTIRSTYPSIIIIMEIPTYGGSERHGIYRIVNAKEKRVARHLKGLVDIIATYSDDKYIWGIKCLNLANCVDFGRIPIRSDRYHPIKKTLRMTCVADFIYYHGADRLIDGIKNYTGEYKLVFNIVGGGAEIPNLKRQASGMDNVIFHGFLSGDKLNDVFDNTDIAIDALGRHRSGVEYNSSLKGKEYAARGIPSISAVKTEFDYLPDFPYYLKVPADDSPICVPDVISFYENIYNHNDSAEVSSFIRNYSYHRFDYEHGFEKPLQGCINRILTVREDM